MLAAKTFIAARLDIEHYAGQPIHDYQVEVYDQDDEAYDFSDLSGFKFELFAKPHGKSITDFDLAEPVDNVYSLDHIHNDIFDALRPALYYYEVYGFLDESPTKKVLINYGIFELI